MLETTIILSLGVALAAFGLTGAATTYLKKRAILDRPNERSSHTVPTPRGGGWGILLAFVPVWIGLSLYYSEMTRMAPLFLGLAALVFLSWTDDRRGLSARLRLMIQVGAVALGLLALPHDGLVFQGLFPLWLDRLLTAIGWVWFVNLYNFMDGLDGLAGSESVCIGVGLAILFVSIGLSPVWVAFALTLGAAALGFLGWNWHPARVFMGDVGSVPVGYASGFLLILLACHGYWAAAGLIPLYFITDASLTLLRRLMAGKPIWQAHREHFYQQATAAGNRHDHIVLWVIAVNGVLIGLSIVALYQPWAALLTGGAVVALLLHRFATMKGEKS